MPLFEVAGLAVSGGTVELLDRVSFALDPGERVAVHGPSGCGKTQLLRTLSGLVDAVRGRILLGGRTAWETGWPAWRRRVVYVPQQPVMFSGTVADNLHRPFGYLAVDGKPSWTRIHDWLHTVGLPENVLDQSATVLSVGQRQRVGLIRALAIRPEVVLLDEPTSALDGQTRRAVQDLVSDLGRTTGLAAVVVTHQPDQARGWCDRSLGISRFIVGSRCRKSDG